MPCQGTDAAEGFSGVTNIAAVLDQAMGDGQPLIFGHDFHQILFDFHGILVFGPSQAVTKPGDMGIHRDTY
jgi:hypothetical protein